MKKKETLSITEENKKLKAEIRALNREIGQRNRTITAMENNFTIKMNMFRALASQNERHQRFLTHMMKSSADFIILLDKELNVAYCSDLFLNKIGMDFFSEMEGEDIFEIYKRLNNKELLRMLKENLYLVLTSNKTCRHDILYDIKGNGELRTFRITNTPMIDEDTGVTSGIIIIWSDTTEEITNGNSDTENKKKEKHLIRNTLQTQDVGKKTEKQSEKLVEVRSIKKEDLPHIPGIDIQSGIDMISGTLDEYIKVLSIFCRDLEKRLPVLRNVPSIDGLSAYILQIHAISRAAAAVGAKGLSEEALRLKTAAEKGNLSFIQEKSQSFVKHMEKLIDRINEIM